MQDILEREPKTSPRMERREGPLARTIEQQTAKLPSDAFLWGAVASLIFQAMGDERKSTFVGHWAQAFLIPSIYNRLVKLQRSESR